MDAKNVSVCTQRRKCVECQKLLVGLREKNEHHCGYADCPSCREYVDVATHKCFIQVVKSPKDSKKQKKKKKQKKLAILVTLEANAGQGMDVEDDEEKPPLYVFFDIDAMEDTGRHIQTC